jgi:hypothetical protein
MGNASLRPHTVQVSGVVVRLPQRRNRNVGKMSPCILSLLLSPLVASSQSIVDAVNVPAIARQFESWPGEWRLKCEVQPIKPVLNFGFRFQSGYVVEVPMNQYHRPGHLWVILIRVTPEDGDRTPVYLGNSFKLTDVPKTNVRLEFGGGFLVGEGRYKVDFVFLDDTDRVFRKTWRVEARLPSIGHHAELRIASNTVDQLSVRSWTAVESESASGKPVRISVLLHAAPLLWRATRLRAADRLMLLGSLSSLVELLPAESVRLTVFNLDQQKDLLEADRITPDTFDRIAQAMNGLELGLVDYRVLRNRRGHMDVLADLINRELSSKQPADAVIVLGATTRYVDKPGPFELVPPGEAAPRFFYIQYTPNSPMDVFPDSIEYAIRKLNGKTMIVRTPKDFADAVDRVKQQLALNGGAARRQGQP